MTDARRPDGPGRRALALYRDAPAAVRAHVTIRWWSAPFRRVVDVLPQTGRILEIGCGHGLFSAYAALDAPGRDVLGVDIDADKIGAATAAARELDRLQFRVAPDGAVPEGPWDAIVFVDVLYLLPADEQRRLLTEAVTHLAPGGCVVVKEMGTHPRWKVRWNTVQETLSVKVLRITEGSDFDFVDPRTMGGWLVGLGLRVRVRRLDKGRVHPHHLLVARSS
ncbi:bifunctional 2-polyprenyl-6-hydroxyphenol methylase/3-demethylubiquinol 3-O-methyltransferase UbiG [Cellulomonas sp. URHE0023]|uniref:class I SAM-dependent methyltransferase n=1 Tax=Cellulomonas sp. URHE0023 TaxID=1380354 RepID=UPI00048538C1|nr:class I SAM-dependent methyltransferase [Cellulomonas sp. URHE0023]